MAISTFAIKSLSASGSGGDEPYKKLGYIDETMGALPTERPSSKGGGALVEGDYYKILSSAHLPFDVVDPFTGTTLTILNQKDTVDFDGVSWTTNLNPFQNTYETPLNDKTAESLSGTADRQSEANAELVAKIKSMKAVVEVETLPTTDIKLDTIYHLTEDITDYVAGFYYHNETSWVLIVPENILPKVDDDTVELDEDDKIRVKDEGIHKGKIDPEAKVVYEEDEQTLTNKTINAEDNEISELETDNLKDGVLDTDIDDTSTNTQLPSSKAVYDYVEGKESKDLELTDSTTESISGTKTTQAETNAEIVDQIKTLKIKPDVVDIVSVYDRGTDETKTDIVHYDTSSLLVNDIIKVIKDETHSNQLSYFKFTGTGFVYIGSEQSADVDDVTTGRNALNQLEVKDEAITNAKINKSLKSKDIPEDEDICTDDKFPTEKAVRLAIKGELENAYSTLNNLEDYLFDAYYNEIDYEYADEYFTDLPVYAACSAIQVGNLLAKSHDWKYDEKANFVVHTPNKDGRYATLGVSSAIKELDNDFVKSREYSEHYKAVPLSLAEGINEKGLACSILVVPQDKGNNFLVEAQVMEKQKFHFSMLPRYILDYFADPQAAAEYVRDYISLYNASTSNWDVHYMISNESVSYLIEFVNGNTVISEMEKTFLTNFHLNGVTLNDDGGVYTPETQDGSHSATTTNNITNHGQGLERWNLINNAVDGIESKADMINLIKSLRYTKTYDTATVVSDPYWYTEFTDETHTVDTIVSGYADVKAQAGTAYAGRTRNGATYHSSHQSVYNISNLTLSVFPQETDNEYKFNIPINAEAKFFVFQKKEEEEYTQNELKTIYNNPELTMLEHQPSFSWDPIRFYLAAAYEDRGHMWFNYETLMFGNWKAVFTIEIIDNGDGTYECFRTSYSEQHLLGIDDTLKYDADTNNLGVANPGLIVLPYKDGSTAEKKYTNKECRAMLETPNNVVIMTDKDLTDDLTISARHLFSTKFSGSTIIAFLTGRINEKEYGVSLIIEGEGESATHKESTIVKINNPNIDSNTMKNNNSGIGVKDEGIANAQINPELKSTEIPEEDASDDKLATEKAVYDIVKIAGHTLSATIDTSTYIMTLILKDKEGNNLSTQTIDLPLESMVLNVEYVNTTEHPKSLKITLQSGTVIYVPLTDILSGVENTSNKVTSITPSSTNVQYPSAKAVYDFTENKIQFEGSLSSQTRELLFNKYGTKYVPYIAKVQFTNAESPEASSSVVFYTEVYNANATNRVGMIRATSVNTGKVYVTYPTSFSINPNGWSIWYEQASSILVSPTNNGLMSSTDKSKLDNIESGANKTVVDTAMSSSSTNPVQNKTVNTALTAGSDKVYGRKGSEWVEFAPEEVTGFTLHSAIQSGSIVKIYRIGKMVYVFFNAKITFSSSSSQYVRLVQNIPEISNATFSAILSDGTNILKLAADGRTGLGYTTCIRTESYTSIPTGWYYGFIMYIAK